MKNNLYFVLILFLFFQVSNAQERSNRIYSYNISEISFYKYNSKFQVKATKEFKNIKNEFPEDLMRSILSCSNQEWEIFNTLGGKDKASIKNISYYNSIKKMDVDKNYFELKHKLEFDIEGVPTSVLKFYFIAQDNPKPQAGIIVMQKYNDRWYKTSMEMISNIALTVLRLKSDEFEKIIGGDLSSIPLKEINKKVFLNGKLDFNKLNTEINSWYADDSIDNKAKKDYFKDPFSIL